MDFLRKDITRCCTAIGETGTLRWDGINCTVKIYKEGEWHDLFEEDEKGSIVAAKNETINRLK